MANANWSNPTLTSTYTNFVSEVKNRDEDLALQFDGTTSTNLVTNTIRWDSSANRWKKWNGTSWAELTSTYALTALSTTGNASIGGVASVPAGSATAASLAVGTGTTYAPGIYSPGTDQLALATGGSGRLYIDSTGKVGIGTSSPGWLLSLRQDSASGVAGNYPVVQINNGNAAGYAALYLNDSTAQAGLETRRDTAHLGFYAGGNERARIDSSGRLGIGTTSPAAKLHVNVGTNQNFTATSTNSMVQLQAINDAANAFTPIDIAGSYIKFSPNSSEAARIDTSGRLLVGTSSARSNFASNTSSPLVQVEGTTAGTSSYSLVNSSNGVVGSTLNLGKTRSTTVGGNTVVASGDQIGIINFQAADGTNLLAAASIESAVDATPGTNDMPGRLVFSTTADGASSPTERMRITNAGLVGIGTTSPSNTLQVGTTTSASSTSPVSISLGGQYTPDASITYSNLKLKVYDSGTDAAGFTTGQTNGLCAVSPAGGPITFITQAPGSTLTERARIDGSGRLLVGTSSTSVNTRLVVQGVSGDATDGGVINLNRGSTPSAGDGSLGALVFENNNGNRGASIAAFSDGGGWTSGSNHRSRLVFSTTLDGAASPTERARINNQGELLVGTQTRTANGGVIQVSNGITFPAAQSACSDPNTLDDYEEGSWTPTIVGLTAAGTGTYSTQVGRYTKMGNTVIAHAYVIWTAHTGTGNMAIGALPFTVANISSLSPISAGWANNLTITGQLLVNPSINSSNAFLYAQSNGTATQLAMDTAANITVTLIYQAA